MIEEYIKTLEDLADRFTATAIGLDDDPLAKEMTLNHVIAIDEVCKMAKENEELFTRLQERMDSIELDVCNSINRVPPDLIERLDQKADLAEVWRLFGDLASRREMLALFNELREEVRAS